MKLLKKILKYGAIALLAIILIPLIIGQVLRLTASVEPPPGKLVDVGGYKLHISCTAPKEKSDEELPTVVIEGGAGATSPNYYWISEGISKTTKVCVYDRAGLGWSDESNLPRDSKNVNTALKKLLDKAEVKRPFVFAGHSIAGLYMRDYVERYPDEVAGLVFLRRKPSRTGMKEFGFTDEQKEEHEMLESANSQMSIILKLLARHWVCLEVYNPIITAVICRPKLTPRQHIRTSTWTI